MICIIILKKVKDIWIKINIIKSIVKIYKNLWNATISIIEIIFF